MKEIALIKEEVNKERMNNIEICKKTFFDNKQLFIEDVEKEIRDSIKEDMWSCNITKGAVFIILDKLVGYKSEISLDGSEEVFRLLIEEIELKYKVIKFKKDIYIMLNTSLRSYCTLWIEFLIYSLIKK